MIVLDASIVVELLIGGASADELHYDLARQLNLLIVPHLLDVEVSSALRKLAAGQRLEARRVEQLLTDLADLPVERCAHTPLLPRIWELRHNFTSYDAVYIALAEATGAVLYTADAKLSEGHRARVRLFSQ